MKKLNQIHCISFLLFLSSIFTGNNIGINNSSNQNKAPDLSDYAEFFKEKLYDYHEQGKVFPRLQNYRIVVTRLREQEFEMKMKQREIRLFI